MSHPSLYGWNWNYALTSNGNGIPPQAARSLGHDPYVAAYSGDNFANAQIDGVTVPIILTTYNAKVTAPILSGHEVTGPNQIVLGAETMQQLHKHLGQTVIAHVRHEEGLSRVRTADEDDDRRHGDAAGHRRDADRFTRQWASAR